MCCHVLITLHIPDPPCVATLITLHIPDPPCVATLITLHIPEPPCVDHIAHPGVSMYCHIDHNHNQ